MARPRRTPEIYRDLMYPVVAISVFLASWEAYVRISGIPNYILPGPSEILLSLVEYAATLYDHSLVTGYEVLLGYGCSIVLGGLFAIMVVWSSTLDKALMPLFLFSQTVSKIAVAPLFVVWLGFGLAPKVLVAFLISFFPVFISTTAGLKSVETEMIELIQSMSANTWQVFRKVRIPTALPHFFAGAKVAVPFATVGAIVGEWMASDSGLGYHLLLMQGELDTAGLFATLLTLSFVSIVIYVVVVRLERLAIPWHVSVRQETGMNMTW